MSAKPSSSSRKFDKKELEESFEHARELSFSEDFETKPSEEHEVSKTAHLFGDFYFTKESAGSKALASNVVSKELQAMRDRLQWGTFTPSKDIPKDQYQTQLSKSRFLSLFLVLRRVVGRLQFVQKKKAFNHWREWLKAYMFLYRSRSHALQPHPQNHSRSRSPNSGKYVTFSHGEGNSGQHHHAHHHHHPHNYHFHGDRNASPEQMRKELYLHHDIFLSSTDADVEQAVMHHLHPHASNHPEQEYQPPSKFQSPNRKASHRRPDVKHAHAVVPSHIVSRNSSETGGSSGRTRSPGSTVVTTASTASRQRISNLSPQQLRKDLHLHHDIFLTSEDDIAEAVLHRAHPHASNHPELEFKGDGPRYRSTHSPSSVPFHIVPRHATANANSTRSKSMSPTRPASAPATSDGKSGTTVFHGSRRMSPEQIRKELHLHHDVFLTSQDDIAEAVLHRVHPHSPNHPEQDVISRFASPKRRASMRLEAQSKGSAQSKVPSHVIPKHARQPSRSPSPSTLERNNGSGGMVDQQKPHGYHFHGERNMSPSQLRKELYLHHDMFLTSEDDIADAVHHRAHPHSPNRSPDSRQHQGFGRGGEHHASDTVQVKRVSCRHMDTLAGSRKDAHLLRKGDPVSHVKAVTEGKHHSNITARPISPSIYSSGVAPAVKPFNHTRDKKHDPKPRMSHSPTRNLPEEHAAKVGIQVKHEELRPGSPSRTLSRALSILVTPASDAIKHDHRVSPEHSVRRTLTALTITGHDHIVGAVVPGTGSSVAESGGNDSDSDYSSDEESDDDEQLTSSRLSGLDISKGLSIRTDVTNDGSVSVTSSSSPLRRSSFSAPTVSHILKLAHRSDSVEKVAAKVAKKRSTVKQTLPKSPHPSQTFPIVPDEIIAKRAERRTSFRSPTKSHAIKVAAKLGGDDVSSVLTGGASVSPSSPVRRKSFADSLPDRDKVKTDETGMHSIRTFIPFASSNNGSSIVLGTTLSNSAVSFSAPSTSPASNKAVRRGSTATSHTPRSGDSGKTATKKNNSLAVTFTAETFDDGDADDASIAVYNVSDSLDNLFDATTPRVAKKKAETPQYKPGTPKHRALMKRLADERRTEALDIVFNKLESCKDKLGKTTTTKSAFRAWKAATGWFRKLEERVPQSIMYLLQVEKETLWRVFCVYCPEKHRIPFSPPNATVAPVLSPEAVERLATGFSSHHDHHNRAATVLHPYHDIRIHDHGHNHVEPSQASVKRDLYLHHDIFLDTTDDSDVTEVLLHKAHRHAMNHPEEGIVVHHEQIKRHSHVEHHHDSFEAHPHQKQVNKDKLHNDVHLHHDVFLSTVDADHEEVDIKRNHPHAANHPEQAVIVHSSAGGGISGIVRPPPISTSPLGRNHQKPATSPVPPQTPLYGLFTVVEDEHDPESSAGRAQKSGKVPADMELIISHPHVSTPPTNNVSDIITARASMRFRKHLLDLDGLWHLFQDFNVVPYLFCKVKLREMFERSITIQPPCSDAPSVPEKDPLALMPEFNVYKAEAPESTNPSAATPNRRVSVESGISAASTASAKRMNKIMETVSGNGSRRAFTSPDGKVQIKLTSFRAPSSVDATAPYIAKVTNPRSKSPAAVLTAAQKKKQEDDYVKAIIAANRKAEAERVAAERHRRRSVGSSSRAGAPSRKSGSPGKPARGMHIAPVEKERRPSISPDRYRPIAEMDLFRVESHSPVRDHPMISFQSFVQLLWEVAASYMDIPSVPVNEKKREESDEEEGSSDDIDIEDSTKNHSKKVRLDPRAMHALKSFVHVMSRYKARMVTKEVEKVLPLLEHDQDLRHKALRIY